MPAYVHMYMYMYIVHMDMESFMTYHSCMYMYNVVLMAKHLHVHVRK